MLESGQSGKSHEMHKKIQQNLYIHDKETKKFIYRMHLHVQLNNDRTTDRHDCRSKQRSTVEVKTSE